MATYTGVFDTLGRRDWCDADKQDGPMTMAELLAKKAGKTPEAAEAASSGWDVPFPSLDALNEACGAIPRTRDLTAAVDDAERRAPSRDFI